MPSSLGWNVFFYYILRQIWCSPGVRIWKRETWGLAMMLWYLLFIGQDNITFVSLFIDQDNRTFLVDTKILLILKTCLEINSVSFVHQDFLFIIENIYITLYVSDQLVLKFLDVIDPDVQDKFVLIVHLLGQFVRSFCTNVTRQYF